MRKLDLMTVGGLVFGFILIISAIAMSGTIMGYISASSILITVLGSFSALLINFRTEQIKGAYATAKMAFFVKELDVASMIKTFTQLATKARREGLLALEEEKESLNDPYFEKGLQMIVDGMEPEAIREIMEIETYCLEERHLEGQNIFKAWATYAPAFGMMGTLIGLVQMLRDLDDPSKIGPAMALALLTTFYGVLLANLILLPIAGKLSTNSKREILEKQIILEGVLAIQSGINPRIIGDKLEVYVSPKYRAMISEGQGISGERGVQVDAS